MTVDVPAMAISFTPCACVLGNYDEPQPISVNISYKIKVCLQSDVVCLKMYYYSALVIETWTINLSLAVTS